jgi:asparagine synthase (glutamine-hydrolysing)
VCQLTFEESGRNLALAIESSVGRIADGHNRVAVAFSGGLDSSIIAACAQKRTRVVACSAFTDGSLDSRSAGRGASLLGIELIATKLTRETVASELKDVGLPIQTSLMDRSLWCLYSIVSRSAARGGAELIMLGQLADELFGGYAKYQKILTDKGERETADRMERDVKEYQTGGMARDVNACSRWLEPRFPFAEKEVVQLGRSIPVSFKIREGIRKAVLREAATVLGVPEELVKAPKKAAQYSSGVQRITT